MSASLVGVVVHPLAGVEDELAELFVGEGRPVCLLHSTKMEVISVVLTWQKR